MYKKPMKRLSTIVLATLSLVSWVKTACAQTADEIIEKHLAASGGRAAFAKLKSRSSVGTVTLATPAGNITGTIETWNQAPNKARTLTKLDLTLLGLGQAVVDQRFDGESGYVLDSIQGNHEITGTQLDSMKNGSFPSPFLNYKEMGATIDLGGQEKVGERNAYLLISKPKAGTAVRTYIDAESYLPVRTIVKVPVPQLGTDLDQVVDFSDFRDVDGIKLPFQVKQSSALQTITINLTKVEHNKDIDPAIFSKPKD
jgi:outer membrane lipoprotein-sorting protein